MYRQISSVKPIFFFHCKGMQREGVTPSQSQQKGSGPAHRVLQCPNCEWASFFLNCQQLESRLPTFFLCVCAPTAKRGWNKGQCLPDHTRQMFEGSPPLARAPRTPENTAKVLFTYSSNSLLADSSFSSKSPQQDEDEGNFQTASYL